MRKVSYKQPYWSKDQTKTINSFRHPDKRLYEIDCYGDLKFDKLIKANQECTSLSKIYHDVLMPESKYVLPETLTPMKGCTSFSVKTPDNHYLLGKNYDWWIANDFCLVVRTYGGKYKTLGVTCSHFFSIENGFKMSPEIAERFSYAPYYVFDGINSVGLSVSTLITHNGPANQHVKGKPYLSTKLIPQLLLSSCATVDECIKTLKKYNVVAYGAIGKTDTDYHWLLTDHKGNKVVVEYIGDKMVIFKDRICLMDFNWESGFAKCLGFTTSKDFLLCTNFYLALDNPKCKQPIDKKTGLYTVSDYGFYRYNRLLDDLNMVPHPDKRQAHLMLKNARYMMQDIDTLCYWRNIKHTPWTKKEEWDGLTTFSMLFDCTKKTMDLCLYENFDKVYKYKI